MISHLFHRPQLQSIPLGRLHGTSQSGWDHRPNPDWRCRCLWLHQSDWSGYLLCLRALLKVRYHNFLHDWPWISPWIKSISNEFYVLKNINVLLTLLMLEMKFSGWRSWYNCKAVLWLWNRNKFKPSILASGSIPCLPWLLKSPEHQQAWYWLCRTDNLYCCSRVNYFYLIWSSQIQDMIQNVNIYLL